VLLTALIGGAVYDVILTVCGAAKRGFGRSDLEPQSLFLDGSALRLAGTTGYRLAWAAESGIRGEGSGARRERGPRTVRDDVAIVLIDRIAQELDHVDVVPGLQLGPF